MTTQITLKREIEQLKQIVNPEPPQDIWLVWAGTGDDPNDVVTAFRMPSKHYPNNITIKCKRGDLAKKIEEVKNREYAFIKHVNREDMEVTDTHRPLLRQQRKGSMRSL